MKIFLTEIIGDKRKAGPRIIAANGYVAERLLEELIENSEVPVNTYLVGQLTEDFDIDDGDLLA